MPRKRRIDIAGTLHHVIVRGIERRKIFQDKQDHEEFLKRFRKSLKETGCICYAWVLIPNHFHLLIKTGRKPLTRLMRSILTGYALYFNRKYRRSGYVYQNRYKSILCEEEAYFLELVRYIHLNPLRSRLVSSLEELAYYAWSGHAVIMGRQENDWQEKDEVLARFGKKRKSASFRYEAFIAEGLLMGRREDLMGGGLRRSAGGWDEVKKMGREKVRWRSDERILGEGRFVENILKEIDEDVLRKTRLKKKGWNLEKIIKSVMKERRVKEKELLSKARKKEVINARALISYLGCSELGLSAAEVGRQLRITRQAVSRAISKGSALAKKHKITLL